MKLNAFHKADNDNRSPERRSRMADREESSRDAVVAVIAILLLITLLPFLLI